MATSALLPACHINRNPRPGTPIFCFAAIEHLLFHESARTHSEQGPGDLRYGLLTNIRVQPSLARLANCATAQKKNVCHSQRTRASASRALRVHGHGVLVVAGRGAPGRARAGGRRGGRGARGWCERHAPVGDHRRHLPAAGARSCSQCSCGELLVWSHNVPESKRVAPAITAVARVHFTQCR